MTDPAPPPLTEEEYARLHAAAAPQLMPGYLAAATDHADRQ